MRNPTTVKMQKGGSSVAVLRTCRAILRELKSELVEKEAREQWLYVTSAVRTDDRGGENGGSRNILTTYLTYLQSTRLHRELLDRYQGRGERSIEESANLVGLRLPPDNETQPTPVTMTTNQSISTTAKN